jgi:hypothetical protein
VPEIADELEHLLAALRVHAVGRLVEEQQVGIVDERLCQLDALLHARRVRLDVAVARLAETDVVQHFVGALHGVGRRQPCELPAVRDKRHGVHAGDVRVAFGHVPDARADRQRRLCHVHLEDGHPAPIRLHEPEQRLQHRALARAVGPEQADRPFRKFRGDVLEGLVLSVDDRDVIQLYDCVHFRSVAYTEKWTFCSLLVVIRPAFTAISRRGRRGAEAGEKDRPRIPRTARIAARRKRACD